MRCINYQWFISIFNTYLIFELFLLVSDFCRDDHRYSYSSHSHKMEPSSIFSLDLRFIKIRGLHGGIMSKSIVCATSIQNQNAFLGPVYSVLGWCLWESNKRKPKDLGHCHPYGNLKLRLLILIRPILGCCGYEQVNRRSLSSLSTFSLSLSLCLPHKSSKKHIINDI